MKESLTAFNANPYMYVFSGIAIGAVLLYVAFYLINNVGIEVHRAIATVMDKQYTESGTTYTTKIIDGRSVVQSYETPETYALTLKVDKERAVALVSKNLYESLNVNDQVNVKVQRTRITGKLKVVKVTR